MINPNTAFDNYFDRTKYVIARNVAVVTAVVFVVLCYFFRAENTEMILYYYIATVLSMFSMVYVLFSRNYKVVFYALTIGATVLVNISANLGSHAIHYSGFSWASLATILSFLGISLRFGLLMLTVNIVGIVVFSLFFLNENIAQIGGQLLTQKIGTAIEVSSITILTGYVMYHFVLFHQHSQSLLEQANNRLESKNELIMAQNEEKTVLMKEIHHRVKNNLQIITSLLRMQKDDIRSNSEDKFDESINRIIAMGLIHQKLYQQDELSKIDVKDYISDLSEEIKSVYKTDGSAEITITSTIHSMGLKTMVPFGLLVNELLTNSFKHAFHVDEVGEIKIQVQEKEKGFIEMTYEDNGEWSESYNSSFGLDLIKSLVEQLEGTFTRTGSKYTFQLLNLDEY